MSRILVTGGTGAFGRAVCTQLARAGADPVAMARHEPADLPAGVRFVAGDMRDRAALAAAVKDCDAVVHLAWFMGVSASVEDMEAINVAGTANLLDAMEDAGCRRLVFASSTTVYGPAGDHPGPFREDEPLHPPPGLIYAVHKEQVERLIAARDLDAVVARTTVVLGRNVLNDPAQAYAGVTLVDIGGRSRVQAVHQEDVGRFLRQAALGDWRGTVNLASPGSVSMRDAGRLLDRRVTTVPLRAALGGVKLARRFAPGEIDADVVRLLADWPVADTTRLTDDWGFTFNWTQEALLRDQGRSASRTTWLMPGSRPLRHRRRLVWAATEFPDPARLRPAVEWRHAAPEGIRGEFDTMIDPAYPLYSATNLSEAFPGPMTPLSLDLAKHGMGATIDGLLQLFGMEGDLADALRVGVGCFAHQPYVNVSGARAMAEVMPGSTVEEIDRMYLGKMAAPAGAAGGGAAGGGGPAGGASGGGGPADGVSGGGGSAGAASGGSGSAGAASSGSGSAGATGGAPGRRVQLSPREIPAAVRLAGRAVPAMVGYRAEVDRLVADVAEVAAVDPATLSDDRLLSHLALVHDLVCQAWNTSSAGNIFLSALQRSVDEAALTGAGAGAAGLTASSGMLHGVAVLADELRRDPATRAAVSAAQRPLTESGGSGPAAESPAERGRPEAAVLSRLRSAAPAFAARFEELLARVGHRGPGETELANEVFADRPDRLLDIVVRAAAGPIRPLNTATGERRPLAALGHRVLSDKERARDAVVRAIHTFRRAARERAARLVAAGRLRQPDDVWYLTYDQLLSDHAAPPASIEARRRERARLAGYRLPFVFEGSWAPESDPTAPAPAGGASGSAAPVGGGSGSAAPVGGGSGSAATQSLRRITGIGTVPGRVTGPARVMRSPSDALEPGEILVARTTDVGWTPWFALAAAVVTDIGGVASHAAIVAREYAIPAVLGAAGATDVLRTGMTITVDGATGVIEILAAPDRSDP